MNPIVPLARALAARAVRYVLIGVGAANCLRRIRVDKHVDSRAMTIFKAVPARRFGDTREIFAIDRQIDIAGQARRDRIPPLNVQEHGNAADDTVFDRPLRTLRQRAESPRRVVLHGDRRRESLPHRARLSHGLA